MDQLERRIFVRGAQDRAGPFRDTAPMPALIPSAPPGATELRRPPTLEAAIADLAELGDGGAPLAGATWVMRDRLWRQPLKAAYVAVGGLDALRGVEAADGTLTVGAAVTHDELAAAAAGGPAAV